MRYRSIGLPFALAGGVIAGSWIFIYSWLVHWGATAEEIHEPLTGDDLVPDVLTQATMAVTIAAPTEKVWPWLIQMGVDRAGLYSYLFVENTMLRLGVTNADRIVPEWQDLTFGDHIWFTPEGYPAPRFGPVVVDIQPNHALVLRCGEVDEPCLGAWQFVLRELPEGKTRLIMRERRSANESIHSMLPNLILEPGYLIMDRGMLLGIKDRAEHHIGNRQAA